MAPTTLINAELRDMNHIYHVLIAILISTTAMAQQQEKIFYNADWKVSDQLNAEYYRLISFDEQGKPVGKVRDYYISGQLQWEGQFSYVDKFDNSKDINEGLCTWYYQNGNKSQEGTYVNNIEEGLFNFWKEDGVKSHSGNFKNGKEHGAWTYYYENGKPYVIYTYNEGNLAGPYFIECDALGNCQNILKDEFRSNAKGWQMVKEGAFKTAILSGEGQLLTSTTGNGFIQTLNVPLTTTEDFSIETNVNLRSGSNNTGHGLVWGFKDWDNYHYFQISDNGYYKIGSMTEGVLLESAAWTTSPLLNQNRQHNLLKVLRLGDEIYYSINGQVVHTENFKKFRGTHLGFILSSGVKEVLFQDLTVKQDVKI